MSDELFDVFSKRDGAGQMYLRDAQLMLGDGSRVVFAEGQAVASAGQARLLAGRDDLTVVPRSAAVTSADDIDAPAPEAEPAPESEPEPDPEQPEGGPLTEAEAREWLDVRPAPAEESEQVRLAREHLEAEGFEAIEPDPSASARAIPAGFEATTADGADRCLARKGDGGQCNNEAVADTHACGIAKHKEQVAAPVAA